MANCKFTDGDGSAVDYTFAKNPTLPFDRNTKVINERTYRLYNGTRKRYSGTEKEVVVLNFENITESQRDSMIAFRTEQFRFYQDSAVASYITVQFGGDVKFTKDVNDSTYSGSITIEEV